MRGFLLILIVILPGIAQAANIGFSLGDLLNNPTAFLSPNIANATVKTLGIVFDHRPMEPATPLGVHPGLDFGIEADIVQVPDSFSKALSDAGLSLDIPPALPSLRMVNIHKGIFDNVDIGGSYLSLYGYTIWAIDLKIVVLNPEEGPTWAIRLSRNSISFPIGSIDFAGVAQLNADFKAVTWTPQILVSKRLDFADPYIGIGYQYAQGEFAVTTTGINLPGLSDLGSVKGSGGSFLSFIGLSLKTPGVGLMLTFEGSYSTSGFNSLGTKFGFSF